MDKQMVAGWVGTTGKIWVGNLVVRLVPLMVEHWAAPTVVQSVDKKAGQRVCKRVGWWACCLAVHWAVRWAVRSDKS